MIQIEIYKQKVNNGNKKLRKMNKNKLGKRGFTLFLFTYFEGNFF